MTPLWAIFIFLNLWWIAIFLVIAVQGQSTQHLKKTVIYSSLLSAFTTAVIGILMEYGFISFYQ